MNARTVWVVEDTQGNAYTASTDEQQAREAGETLAEFDTSHNYFLQSYTLN